MNNLVILGATGSIGQNTLAVVDLHPEQFSIFALSAHTNWRAMLDLCKQYQPRFVIMTDVAAGEKLKQHLTHTSAEVLLGVSALCEVVGEPEVDTVMAAVVGSVGMQSTLAAIKADKRVLLANKESLVLAGNLLMQALQHSKAILLPVDSEHSAIYQCLESGKTGLKKIQLTASGGPFLHTDYKDLHHISPEQACCHPNWSMGQKISVDSATMMNKGLEAIEAHYLFDLAPEQIEVVVHPQSVVHSLVCYEDGSALAQLSVPDMKTAIAYALAYPKRMSSGVADLDLSQYGQLSFFVPDFDKFACLRLSFEALKAGSGTMGTLNAANEVAVVAFLQGRIGFLDIAKVIEQTLNKHHYLTISHLEDVLENDQQARKLSQDIINKLC